MENSCILTLRGLEDFFPGIVKYLKINDVGNLLKTCKTFKTLIENDSNLMKSKIIDEIWEKHSFITQNLNGHFKTMANNILDTAISMTKNKYHGNFSQFLEILSLLKEYLAHQSNNSQIWFKVFFKSLKNESKLYKNVNELEKTILEFKYLTVLASFEIFQTKKVICIPPYFSIILSDFIKISKKAFNLWLESKTMDQPLDIDFLVKTSMEFLHNLNGCKVIKKKFEKKLPKIVAHYKDIIFAMANISTLVSDRVCDTIYYELIKATPRENPYTKSLYVKFLPLF